jgi:hypothetical protein
VLATILIAAMTCGGTEPGVVAVTLHGVTRTQYLDRYRIQATVSNSGERAQAGDTLQFLDVMYYGTRIDARGIPPLAPGQSYTVTYVWPRSVDAGRLTSPLNFEVRPVSPGSSEGCTGGGRGAGITV